MAEEAPKTTRPGEEARRPGEDAHKKQADVEVVLIRDWDVHKIGDVIKVPAEQAKSLIFHQVANEEGVDAAKGVADAKKKADEKARADARAAGTGQQPDERGRGQQTPDERSDMGSGRPR